MRGDNDQTAHELALELDALIMQQRDNWLARSRRGGLDDSIRRLETLREEYLAL